MPGRTFHRELAHAVVYNPRANAGKGLFRWQKFLSTSHAEAAGLRAASVFDGRQVTDLSRYPEILERWMAEELAAGARNFVAAGGDGTVHLTLNALIRAADRGGTPLSEVRLGAVGIGSSNDFHKPFGLSGRTNAEGIPCRLSFAGPFAHDLGFIRDDAGHERYFVVNTSMGVTAEGCWIYNRNGFVLRRLKRRWVNGAVLWTGLRTCLSYRNIRVRISVDGGEFRECWVTNLSVVKNPHFAGSLRYDTGVLPDDGRLGVHLSESMTQVEMLRLLNAVRNGRFRGRPKTECLHACSVMLEAEQPFSLETDGEVTRTRRAQIEIRPRALAICP